MSSVGKRLIWIGPADGSNQKPLLEEGVCTEAALPGAVMDYAAASAGFELMDDAATVFGKPLIVANKNEMQSKSVDDAWTVDENMTVIRPRSGEFLHVLCVTAQALVRGTPLTRSAVTPGALVIALLDGTQEVLCYADEVITTTATQLVRVRVA